MRTLREKLDHVVRLRYRHICPLPYQLYTSAVPMFVKLSEMKPDKKTADLPSSTRPRLLSFFFIPSFGLSLIQYPQTLVILPAQLGQYALCKWSEGPDRQYIPVTL